MNKFSSALLCVAAGVLLCLCIGVIAADKPTTRPAKAKKPVAADQVHPKPISQLMIWNGEDFKGGGSWVTKGNTFKPTSEVAHSGKTCLEFHGEGSGYIGGGYNFFGWYPPDSGIDVSNYDNLSMWVRIDSPPQMGPASVTVALNSSSNRKESGFVKLSTYCKDLDDGNWHEIVIPLKHLYTHTFDPETVWELEVNTWQGDDRRFSIYIDDIAVDIRPPAAPAQP